MQKSNIQNQDTFDNYLLVISIIILDFSAHSIDFPWTYYVLIYLNLKVKKIGFLDGTCENFFLPKSDAPMFTSHETGSVK